MIGSGKIQKGDIFLADLNPVRGSEQGNVRPVLIIQNNIANKHSPVVIIAAITSKIFSKEFPTNVYLSKSESKLDKDSTVLLNQIRTVDKSRLIKRISFLEGHIMNEVEGAIKISLDLD